MATFTGNYITADTGVFWDTEDCEVPEELNASQVVEKFRDTLTGLGHRGTVIINAYGDKKDHDFNSTGVNFNQFPVGEKHARHTKMMEDIVSFASEHPEPSTVMLVLGDVSDDFVEIVKLLKDRKNYVFLHVHPKPRPTVVLLIVPPNGGGDSDSDN